MFELSTQDRPRFMKQLEKMNTQYDPQMKALKVPFSSPGYHTTLKDGEVHSTRTAFQYALALLDSGEEGYLERAQDVLRGVIALQETDPAIPTYGIWSWFYEEPLAQMSPPDWNWADFCGKEMMMIAKFHGERLAEDVQALLEQSTRHACLSIFRRNMHSGYTNISIMGSYVTMFAGEFYGWPEIFAYGASRFERFCDFTRANGAFAEYNSPTYTITALEDLTRIADHVSDPKIHKLALEMVDVAWFTIATHYHAPTRQWAGPHARAYRWLQGDINLSLIQRGTHDAVKLVSEEDYHLDVGWTHINLDCPEKYYDSFRFSTPHDAGICYGQVGTDLRSIDEQPAVANCYLDETFALGSFVRCNAWNQVRNLLGYWGEGQQCFMSVRVLHDFYDFCSARVVTAQKGGKALFSVTFVTDGGDTHVNLDPVVDAAIRARDLRIRIEVGNTGAQVQCDGNAAWIAGGGMTVAAQLLGGMFDGGAVELMVPERGDTSQATAFAAGQASRVGEGERERQYIDVVFYHGEEREVRLDKLQDAFASVALSLAPEKELPDAYALKGCGEGINTMVTYPGLELKTTVPTAPCPSKDWRAKAYVDGSDLDTKYKKPIK